MLIPEIITSLNPAETLMKDVSDLVTVAILPFCIWVTNQIWNIKDKQRDQQHELGGVDGRNGLKSKVIALHERLDIVQDHLQIANYEKLPDRRDPS